MWHNEDVQPRGKSRLPFPSILRDNKISMMWISKEIPHFCYGYLRYLSCSTLRWRPPAPGRSSTRLSTRSASSSKPNWRFMHRQVTSKQGTNVLSAIHRSSAVVGGSQKSPLQPPDRETSRPMLTFCISVVSVMTSCAMQASQLRGGFQPQSPCDTSWNPVPWYRYCLERHADTSKGVSLVSVTRALTL